MYWVTLLLGIISMAAPYLFGYSDNTAALWTGFIVGAVLMGTSVMEWLDEEKRTWEYWVAGLAGISAIAAPFVLGFGGLTGAVWTLALIGIVTVVISGARLFWGGGFRTY